MSVFVWIASYGSELTVSPETYVHRNETFGADGEETRVALGPTTRTWSLKFENRPNATADQIEAFLAAADGVASFDWVPSLGPAGKWVCDEWSTAPTSPSHRTITARFREVHGEV